MERLRLRPRRRARRGWSVQALLDEREQLLKTLDALGKAREAVATRVRKRAAGTPSACYWVEEVIRKAQGKVDHQAEIVRHRLLLDDSLLSSRGVRPWENERSERGN